MNDTYLQDFGTRRAVHRSKPKVDPMAASGRWDDLYLRASKPRLKQTRRQGMRRDLTITVKNGPSFKIASVSGKVTDALGFHCDPVAVKYKLDSPSYPSRHRELSQQDRVKSPKVEMQIVGVRHVYDVLAELITKLRFRAPNEFTTRTFRALWANRHALKAKATIPRKSEMPKTAVISQPVPVRVEAPKPKPRKVAKAIYEEFEKNREMLASIDHAHWHGKDSWHERLTKRLAKVKQCDWESRLDGMRQDLARRQKVLLGIIEAGK